MSKSMFYPRCDLKQPSLLEEVESCTTDKDSKHYLECFEEFLASIVAQVFRCKDCNNESLTYGQNTIRCLKCLDKRIDEILESNQ